MKCLKAIETSIKGGAILFLDKDKAMSVQKEKLQQLLVCLDLRATIFFFQY